ncbi:hypothetical protein [Vibrio spartinae]|uniref:Uncharacterized protein n=1 Tax=Vibrio spartinae TaxID=1918945 RepID=A0A1N6MB77_9VIBR|nr:hypothetical protein [Vibrio spartinae]SIO96702.1 hypothetical protein VSP9026_04508 [Vibrio spartinae]
MKHEIKYRKSMTGGIVCQVGNINVFIDEIKRVNGGEWLALHSFHGDIIGMAEGEQADDIEVQFYG